MKGARPDARGFVEFVLSERGQAILARRGFGRGR
jgi:ABC-type molybdate transport system substrate-binding protein